MYPSLIYLRVLNILKFQEFMVRLEAISISLRQILSYFYFKRRIAAFSSFVTLCRPWGYVSGPLHLLHKNKAIKLNPKIKRTDTIIIARKISRS